MDPNNNGVWSTSEINIVKSIIASHNANNTYAFDTNKKHTDIVDELQSRFPFKEKHQVIDLYVELAVEMMNMTRINNQHVVENNAPVNGNFGMPTEGINVNNIEMLHGYQMEDVESMIVEEQLHRLNFFRKKNRQPVKFWTQNEHKNFLRGLEVYGRGNWKNISKYFVPTQTPVQISSHAQKYFHRRMCTTRKQRFSINDVGLYDTESWVQNNSSRREAFTFIGSSHNTKYYDFDGHHVALNNLTHASQATKNQVATWTRGQHTTTSSFVAPAMVKTSSPSWEALTFTESGNTNYYVFGGEHNALNNQTLANQASKNQVATLTSVQQAIPSSSVAPAIVQNNSPGWDVLTFGDGAYNTNYYDIDEQNVALNNLARSSQATSNQVATWTTDPQASASSSVAPRSEGCSEPLDGLYPSLAGWLSP